MSAQQHLSKRLASIIEDIKSWPAERQEAAADILEQLGRQAAEVYLLSDEERADVDAALDEARRGEFARDAEVAAVLERHGL